jgi:hypothetical protein
MEYITALLLGLVVVEIYAWLPRVSRWIGERAVRLLPKENRERWREEFQEGQDSLPQTAWRFVNALTLCYGALQIRRDLATADREDAFAMLEDEVTAALSTYQGMVSTIRATAAMSASSTGNLRPVLSNLQNQVLSLSGRCSEETFASLVDSVSGFSQNLLNASERAHCIVAVEIEKVSKVLQEAGPSAAYISRNWSYVRKIWQVSRGLPFIKNVVFMRLVLSVRDETRALSKTLKLDGIIDTASMEEAKRITNALHQLTEKRQLLSK